MDVRDFELWITHKRGDPSLNCFHLACKCGKFEVIQFLIQTLDESILKKCLRFPSDKSQRPPADLNEYVEDLFSQIRASDQSTNSRSSGSQAHNRTLKKCCSFPAASHVSESSPSNQQKLRRNNSTSSYTSTSSAMSHDADSSFQHAQEVTLKALSETKTKNQLSVLDVLRDPLSTNQRQPAARTSVLSACAAEFVPGK
jgi:hypothetical protein